MKVFLKNIKTLVWHNTIFSHAVLGGLVGYFVVHPIGMLMTRLMHYREFQDQLQSHVIPTIKEILVITFSFEMLFWSIVFTLIGMSIGAFYGYWISRVLKLLEKKASSLAESESGYRTLVENSSSCICSIDLKGDLLYMNSAGLEQHALTLSKAKKLNCLNLAKPVFKNLLRKKIAEAKDGNIARVEYECMINEETKWFESIISPITDGNGNIKNLLMIETDITDYKLSEINVKSSVGDLQTSLWDAINALALLAEKKVPYSVGHHEHVSYLAEAIAREMDLPQKQIECVSTASIVHDIGMVNVPGEILSKPDRLSVAEFELIKVHPRVGWDMLRRIAFPWPIADIVYQHHERLDGSGYPRGLTSEDIKIEAKILAVADVVDAICSSRSYRDSLSIKEALIEIQTKKGILYDSDVVDSCVKIINTKGFRIPGWHLKYREKRIRDADSKQEVS